MDNGRDACFVFHVTKDFELYIQCFSKKNQIRSRKHNVVADRLPLI